MLARLLADLRERLLLGAVFPAVLAAGATEHLGGRRGGVEALLLVHHVDELVERVRSIGPLRRQGTGFHLLEPDDDHALGEAARDRLRTEHQRGAAGGAVVVDVEHRDAGEAELVDRALAAGRIAVHVAGVRLLHLIEGDLRVGERGLAGLRRHHVILLALAGLGEGDHPDADDIYFAWHVHGLLRSS